MIPVFTHPPGISAALYEAALADLATAEGERDAAEAKLVAVGEWVDLTATITTACAGAAASDPDSLKAGLTVTTTTGTFDGATIPCNQFNWTTHNTANDGYDETLNFDLGLVTAHCAGYNPATHGVQMEIDLVAPGTLNSARPMVCMVLAPGGALTGVLTGPCWRLDSVTSCVPGYGFDNTGQSGVLLAMNPATSVARTFVRCMPTANGGHIAVASTPASDGAAKRTGTYTTSDKLFLMLGQGNATAGAVSGLKARLRVRIFAWANIDLADLELGCQS